MKRGILLACAGLLASACDSKVEETTRASVSTESARVRVCRAATDHFNKTGPLGDLTVRQDSADRVELSYAVAPNGVGMSVECAFQGEQVIWRPVAVTVPSAGLTDAPAQRQAETLTYSVNGDTVRLTQRGSNGSSSEITWTGQGRSSVTTETNWSVQVGPGSTNDNAATEAE